jgi:serine/threonine-protein kinase RsbW
MNGPIRFKVTNKLSELAKIAQLVREFSVVHGLGSRCLYLINLVLDEVVTNIISYGFNDDKEHTIQVELSVKKSILTIRIEDDGCPFSIVNAPKINAGQSLEERPIGGLGCHLVNKMMDEVSYERRAGRNFLRMKKNLKKVGAMACG